MLRDRLAHNDIGACHCEAIQMMASDPNAPHTRGVGGAYSKDES